MSDTKDIPKVLTPALVASLKQVATATLAHQMQQRGIRNAFLPGLKVMHPDMRMVGRARTLRYVAAREDVQPAYSKGLNAQRKLVETCEPGDVVVIEARGVPDAATIGDIYATRAVSQGAVGFVTDGALRDTPAIADMNQPVYHLASHGATLGRMHMPFSCDEPITCAGVFVMPGDVVVGDGEGAVVIPMALIEEVTRDALAQEDREAFALERVQAGESTVGLFPMTDARRPEYEAWSAKKRE